MLAISQFSIGCLSVASSVVGASGPALGACFDYKGAEKGAPAIVTPPKPRI